MAFGVQVVIDCADPSALAPFWAQVLGYIEQPPPEGFDNWQDWARQMGIPEEDWNKAGSVVDPDGKGPRFFFQQVPEGKVVKNRVHVDVNVGAGFKGEERHAEVEKQSARVKSLGGSVIRVFDERDEFWIVMPIPRATSSASSEL